MKSTTVKTLAAVTLGLFVLGTVPAFAADAENNASATSDTSVNPITGTKTTTKKMKHKMKGAHGKSQMNTTETTKEKTDGSTTKEVKQDASAETKP